MVFLADTSEPLAKVEGEIGMPVGQLLTPLNGLKNRARDEKRPWAIDNGAFSGFNEIQFRKRLGKESISKEGCLFVAVPDIVGSARRTLEVFDYWYGELHGWPLALVAQDDLQNFRIPWDRIACLFIGGTTAWKIGPHAEHCVRAAKTLGKWVHVGRINTALRLDQFNALQADSCDGSGASRFSHMRQRMAEGLPLLPRNIPVLPKDQW